MEPWVGQWLREQRLKTSDKLDDIAARLRSDTSTVSRLETGDCSFAADDLPVVLRAYNVTARQFADRAAKEAA
jgi:transcriptional regulator with XRE-family HTH domain